MEAEAVVKCPKCGDVFLGTHNECPKCGEPTPTLSAEDREKIKQLNAEHNAAIENVTQEISKLTLTDADREKLKKAMGISDSKKTYGSGWGCFWLNGCLLGIANAFICMAIGNAMRESAHSFNDLKWAIQIPVAVGELLLILQLYFGSTMNPKRGFWMTFLGYLVAYIFVGLVQAA